MNEETDATDIPGDTGIAILCASAEAFKHQKRRAAAVGKWHSACPEVRLYRSEVSCGKDIATCWQTV